MQEMDNLSFEQAIGFAGLYEHYQIHAPNRGQVIIAGKGERTETGINPDNFEKDLQKINDSNIYSYVILKFGGTAGEAKKCAPMLYSFVNDFASLNTQGHYYFLPPEQRGGRPSKQQQQQQQLQGYNPFVQLGAGGMHGIQQMLAGMTAQNEARLERVINQSETDRERDRIADEEERMRERYKYKERELELKIKEQALENEKKITDLEREHGREIEDYEATIADLEDEIEELIDEREKWVTFYKEITTGGSQITPSIIKTIINRLFGAQVQDINTQATQPREGVDVEVKLKEVV